MTVDSLRRAITRRPGLVVGFWVVLAVVVTLTAPNLTKLAAEGQAKLLPKDIESALAALELRKDWPDQAYESLAVAAFHRESGLTEADRRYVAQVARAVESAPGRPKTLLRFVGPHSPKVVAERLISRDKTLELFLAHLSETFVSPGSQEAVAWFQKEVSQYPPPKGLEVGWSGDGVIGRDYMNDVEQSLHNAEKATVVLLLIVLLAVYRSPWLAVVPLATIGVSLAIARGVLGWLVRAGWEVSPLVELFLVVLLFGCGTDFCLFVSWRFGEHWNAADPAGAMRKTLRRVVVPIATSAGTVVAGLCLMGFTRFKLFSSTGPSVALGLVLTLFATLSLTPALLILLARYRPRAFTGLTSPSSGFWNVVGQKVLSRPLTTWLATVALMLPAAILGLGMTTFLHDTIAEMPRSTPSVRTFDLISRKFRPGELAPLTVLLRADVDLGKSEGLELIDNVSRLLEHQRQMLVEVRSATQPLGSSDPLRPARLDSRLRAVNEGFSRMSEGATLLRDGLTQGAAKLRTAILLEDATGFSLTGAPKPKGEDAKSSASDPILSGMRQATSSLFGLRIEPKNGQGETEAKSAGREKGNGKGDGGGNGKPKASDPREKMLEELNRAADGADQIAKGAVRASRELSSILNNPVGRRALDRLLITPETIRENPQLLQSFAAYLSPDHHTARFDLIQRERFASPDALDDVLVLRRRLKEYLGEMNESPIRPRAVFTGPNAQAADIRDLTDNDQRLTWIIVPLGVFLVLLLALRDALACVNLVATMLLTYAFALGATHLVFVNLLGGVGLDWKVPYFLFVLLVAVGVDYNVFLMTRLQEESRVLGLRAGTTRAISQTGGLITSAAAITACSFASFLFSPLVSLRQLGFALVVGITVDAVLVRPVLVPCGQWLLNRGRDRNLLSTLVSATKGLGALTRVGD